VTFAKWTRQKQRRNVMPHISEGLHGMDNLWLSIAEFAKGSGNNEFATLRCEEQDRGGTGWSLFFSSVNSIRLFHVNLGIALENFDLSKQHEADLNLSLGEQPDGAFKVERMGDDSNPT
jgi:hypothetical protein